MLFAKLPTKTQIILSIQCIGMLAGTSTHLWWIVHKGFLSEDYHVPLLSKLFWDSLVVLDPLAAILLITRPKWGVRLTAFIIIVDVIHNSVVGYSAFFENTPLLHWIARHWMLACQIAFGLFVIATFKSNLQAIRAVQTHQ